MSNLGLSTIVGAVASILQTILTNKLGEEKFTALKKQAIAIISIIASVIISLIAIKGSDISAIQRIAEAVLGAIAGNQGTYFIVNFKEKIDAVQK